MNTENRLFEGKEVMDLFPGRKDLQPQPKTSYYLTRPTIRKHLQTLINRIMTERIPYDIGELVVFGSYVKGKEKPNDLDIVIIDSENEERELSYEFGRECFLDLLQMGKGKKNEGMFWWLTAYGRGHFVDCDYITSKLLRRGMKNVHIQYHKNISDFIRTIKVNDELQEVGLDFKVLWSSSWVDEKDMKCWKQHPLTPFLRYLHMVENTQVFKAFNIDHLPMFDKLIKKPFDKDDKEQYQKILGMLEKINTGVKK